MFEGSTGGSKQQALQQGALHNKDFFWGVGSVDEPEHGMSLLLNKNPPGKYAVAW